jgi:hypothetical protein
LSGVRVDKVGYNALWRRQSRSSVGIKCCSHIEELLDHKSTRDFFNEIFEDGGSKVIRAAVDVIIIGEEEESTAPAPLAYYIDTGTMTQC